MIVYIDLFLLYVESGNNMESIRESYVNTVNELNQELSVVKEAYDQLDADNQRLTNELENQFAVIDQKQLRQTIGMLIILFYMRLTHPILYFRKSTIRCVTTAI
jgi:hypothetical protein